MKQLIAILSFIFSSQLYAQTCVKVKVVDAFEQDSVLPGSIIRFGNMGKYLTNENGMVMICGVMPGEYDATVSHYGFVSSIERFTVGADTFRLTGLLIPE